MTVCNLPIPAAAAGAERHKGVQSGPAARHVELHKCCVRAISTQLLASRLHRSPKKRNRLPRSRLRRPHRSSSEIKVIPALHTTLNSGRIYHLEGVGYGRIVGVLQQPRVPKLLQERLVLRAKGVARSQWTRLHGRGYSMRIGPQSAHWWTGAHKDVRLNGE